MTAQYYSPDFELDVRPSNMDNANSPEYLEKIKTQVFENIRATSGAPSVQMTDVPRAPLFPTDNENDPDNQGDPEDLDEREARLDDEDEDTSKDQRYSQRRWDQRIERDDEFEDSDDEEQAERNGVRRQPDGRKTRPGIMDYQNPHAPQEDDVQSGAQTPAGDATPANGAADEMVLDPTSAPAAASSAANAAVGADILAAKAADLQQSEQPPNAESASNAAERNGPISAPDVAMQESGPPPTNAPNAPTVQSGAGLQVTPPDSPHPAPAVAPDTATTAAAAGTVQTEDVEMAESAAEARAEGAAERNAEDVEAERRREADGSGGVI